MSLALIVLLPFLLVLPVWAAGNRSRVLGTALAALAPIGGLALLLPQLAGVLAGTVQVQGWSWIPRLGLDLAFRLDGLSALFALLILGIGLLVVIYAAGYLGKDEPVGSFYAMLLSFMGAMLGVVLSENLLAMVVFWELTSISSFLLIGFWTQVPAARQGARLALTITGGGGLALLAGVILLSQAAGSANLTDIFAQGSALLDHPQYPLFLVLVLLGAFTKSAQFPFHFWLPNAMTAPTPVSAYLHSATMVKAGVFLLARLWPTLSGSALWFFLVTGTGLLTMVVAAWVALYKHDLKGLLAWSTLSHLGLITTLLGFGSPLAGLIAVFHILNHAAFKASLFMSAGIVDHETGTRDARKLGGLYRSMPITFVLATLGSMAMGGVPLFNGFISKEMFFEESVHRVAGPFLDGAAWAWALPALVTLGGLCSVAYSVRLVVDVFLGAPKAELSRHPHDPPATMWAPVAALILVCAAVGVAPAFVAGPLVAAAGAAVTGGLAPEVHLSLWHGITPALGMTALAFVGGPLLFLAWRPLERAQAGLLALDAKAGVERAIDALVELADRHTRWADNGSVQRYFATAVGFILLAGAAAWLTSPEVAPVDPIARAASVPELVLAFVLLLATGVVVRFHRNRILAVVFISVVGLVVSLAFVWFSAPDLGLTQISVEVVTILLMLLALYVLPAGTPSESSPLRRGRDALLALGAGGGVAAMAYGVMVRPQETIGGYYLESSKPLGGGTNVVNVILVDFRGFDTMGEISVLLMASLGVLVLLAGSGPVGPRALTPLSEDRFPAMLTSVTRPMLSLVLLMAVYIFLRGHNLPGGGFIAGLIAVVALIIQYVASGIAWTEQRLQLDFRRMGAIGVLIAVSTGLAPWLFRLPFLTSGYTYLSPPLIGKFEVASAAVFDLGVFLTVIGSMMIMMGRLARYQNSDELAAVHGRRR